MSPESSKLNPYAAEYIPLAKTLENVLNLEPILSDSGSAFAGSSSHIAAEEGHGFHVSSSHEHGQFGGSHADDEDLEIDLANLQSQFPTVSKQSLLDVYFANDGDVDAAHDMLTQLENLPDSLDIGDVSEPQILPEFEHLKLKEVAGVTSSGSADSPAHSQPQSQT